MNKHPSTLKTNIVYGVLVIVPLAVIFLLIAKIVEILEKIAEPLQLDSYISVLLAVALALLMILAICFAVGALVRTRIGSWSFERLERTLLNQIPGYQIASKALKGFAIKDTAYPKAMIKLFGSETSVLGFVMEENDNGSVTVFVPSTPTITIGSIYIVDSSRVTPIEASMIDVVTCISQWGIGSRKIIGNRHPEQEKG